MRPFKRVLSDSLKDVIPEDAIGLLPSGFQRIGDIIILNLDQGLGGYEREIAKAVMGFYKVKTVCVKDDSVKGEFREPCIRKVLGGSTMTEHIENRCRYSIDVTKVMFSQGNLVERGRIAKLVRKGEVVADMFAGIGYFTIPIAKKGKASVIYAIEKNPESVKLMEENVKINKVDGVKIINSDCRRVGLKGVADRVIMGYFPGTFDYLEAAFNILKDEGIIHFHEVFLIGDLWEKPIRMLKEHAERNGYELVRVLDKRKVKHYGPCKYHVVLDCLFKRVS